MRIKSIKIVALFIIVLLSAYYFRVFEYFNILSSKINVSSNRPITFSILNYVGKNKIPGFTGFDTIVILKNEMNTKSKVKDKYGENLFLIQYKDTGFVLSCSFFNYKGWYKYQLAISNDIKADTIFSHWILRRRGEIKKGIDTFYLRKS